MAPKSKFTRRGFLPILGGSLLLPFLGTAKSPEPDNAEEEFDILLKPDGTPVKVRKSTLKKSKTVKKKISNSGLLNWLGMK
jgi:hypothetical protein